VRKNVVLNHNAFIGASPEAFTFIFLDGRVGINYVYNKLIV